MKNYTIHLIRHGKTLGNDEGRYIGVTDLPLSDDGKFILSGIKEKYIYPTVQIAYSSPLVRCQETADIIYPDIFVQTVEDLREYDFGAFENRTIEDLRTDSDYKKWTEEAMFSPPPQGEDKNNFDERIISAFEEILKDMMARDITNAAVFTHAGVISMLLAKCGVPTRSPLDWVTADGFGYTVNASAFLWSSDKHFEIVGILPYPQEQDISANEDDII